MKRNVTSIMILAILSVMSGCSSSDESVSTVELESFSSLVRDAFANAENDETVSVIEGTDFKFEDADQLETYSDLLIN